MHIINRDRHRLAIASVSILIKTITCRVVILINVKVYAENAGKN